MPNIQVSQQTYDEFERLKNIMIQMLDKDQIDNDQIISSLVGGFMDSLSHDMVDHIHMPSQGSCCGGVCKTKTNQPKQSCCGGACGGHH